MALAQYSDVYWFPSGALAAAVPARVFEHTSNTLATLWADAGGTIPLANPLDTSAAGVLTFWAEEGQYWVHIDSEAFEIAVGAAAQPATQQDILDEEARADAAYAAILHAATHAEAGGDPVILTQAQITGLAAALAAKADLAGATFTGAVTVDGADLAVLGAAKGYRFRRGGGALDLEATGSDLLVSNWSGPNFDGTQRSYDRYSADATNVQHAGKREYVAALFGGAVHTIDPTGGGQLGWYGAAPVGQQTVTGSRTDGTALASLLTALATLGLIVDNSTA